MLEITASKSSIILHENILDILFQHKEEIYRKLINIKGIFLIDHVAIKIIDKNNKMMIFSLTPSVEYNLIVQDLWRLDKSFSLNFNKQHVFYTWDEAYAEQSAVEIKQIKEIKHGFTYGFNISKQLNQFMLIYSFATRSKNANLSEYYRNHIDELSSLGDYGYKLVFNIYTKYADSAPQISDITHGENISKKPFLKLIVNNK